MNYINTVRLPNNTEVDINTTSTNSVIGLVKPDNSTIKVDSTGTIRVNEFYGTSEEVQTAIQSGLIGENTVVYITNDTAIEEGGGHTIINGSGIEMSQEANLKFVNLNVTDDPVNSATVITAPIATGNVLGLVRPDESTVSIDSNGVISSVVINPVADDINENVTFGTSVVANDADESVTLQ